MDIMEAYNNSEVLGYIRGQQSAQTYTAVVNKSLYKAGVVESQPPQVGEDAVVMVKSEDGRNIFVVGKVVSVEADSDVKVGVYVQGGQPYYAPFTVIAKFVPQATFVIKDDKAEVISFRTVLNTGTEIKRLTREFIDAFINMFSQKKVFTPGRFLGSDVPVPLWLPHFGDGDNGIGEAYHIGIFGRTGSGKSALAKILMAYYAMHSEMSVIVLDPQGEFLRDFQQDRAGKGTYPLDVDYYWHKTGGKVIYAPISRMTFEDKDDIRALLMAVIHRIAKFVGISGDKRERLVDAVLPIFHAFALYLHGKDERVSEEMKRMFRIFGEGQLGDVLKSIRDRDSSTQVLDDMATLVLDRIDGRMDDIYDTESSRKEKRGNIERLREDKDRYEEFKEALRGILLLIEGDKTIDDLIKETISGHNLLVLSVSDVEEVDEFLQYFLIDTFLRKLVRIAGKRFKRGEHLNTMVFLDEAHRFVPSSRADDAFAESLRKGLIRAVRETRKYGLGWTFISQTLGSLAPDVIYQIRIFFIGYGLVMASEREKVRELVSGYPGSMDVYMSFPDPFSAKFFGKSIFPFMAVGPASPLSATGAPLFFASYDAIKVKLSLSALLR